MDILTLIPAVASIFALSVFSRRTRWLCYSLVNLSILAEIPAPVNLTALIVCIACLFGLFAAEFLRPNLAFVDLRKVKT